MPGPKLTATRGSEKREFAGDDAELLRAAVEKGWAIDGHTVVRREDAYRAVPADRGDLLEAATSKGWSVAGAPLTEGLPDIPLAADQGAQDGRWAVTADAVDQGDLQRRQEALEQQRFAREIAGLRAEEQRQAELQQEHGAGLTTAKGLANTAATTGEALSRGVSLGFDAPAAGVQAVVEQGLEAIAGPANPDVPRTLGESFDAAKQGIAGRQEANPLLATGAEVVGAVAPALATGGQSLAARVLAKTPAGFVARKAAQYGAAAGAKAALTAPGLKGAVMRVAAPAVRLGVEGGVQGAAQGAGAAANQLWMDEDAHGVAEYLAAGLEGAWDGGKLGAALGAGIGAVQGARALGSAVEPAAPAAGNGLLRLDEAAEAPAMTAYPEPAQPGFVKRQVAKVVGIKPEQAAKIRDEAHPKLVQKWNEFIGAREQLENLNVAAKKAWARRVAPEPAQFSFSSVIDDEGLGLSKAHLEALANEGYVLHGNGAAGQVKLLAKRLDTLETELMEVDLTTGATHGDVVNALDQAKRDADKLVAWAEARNPALYAELAPRVQQLRELLENEEVVGAVLANAQRRGNGTWAPAIRAQMDSALDSMEATKGVQKVGSYKSAGRVNDSWLTQRLAAAGSNVEMQSEDAVNRLLNTATDDYMTRSEIYGSKEAQAAAKRVAQLRDEIQAEMGGIAKINRSVEAPSGSNMTVLGTEIPGSGYAIEAARNRIAKSAHKTTIDTAKRVESAGKLTVLLGDKASAQTAAATKLAEQREKMGAAIDRFYDRVASGEAEQENARYAALLEQAFGPDMAAAERQRFTAQQQFLMTAAGDPKDPRFKSRFRRYAEPALHPLEAIDRMAAGEATPEDRETLKALHPRLLTAFTLRAIEAAEKSKATYDQRLRISQAIGVPLDPSLEPARYQMHQEIAAQQAGQAAGVRKAQQDQVVTPGNRKPPEMDGMVQQ